MRKFLLFTLLVTLSASLASGDYVAEMTALINALKKTAAALGILLISIQGLKYVTAESPDDRAEAKKGIIYVILGLLIAYIAGNLVCGLYCAAIASTYGGITCNLNPLTGVCYVT